MKTAEDIYQNNYNLDKDEDGNEVFYKWQVLDAIKQAQEDAIKETIKECLTLSKLKFYAGESGYLDKETGKILADKLIKEL